MTYADQTRAQKPFGMAAAIAVNGSIIAAIMLSPMVVNRPDEPTRTTTVFVEPQTPPPDPITDDPAKQKQQTPIFVPESPVDIPIKQDPIRATDDPPIADPGIGTVDKGKDGAPDFGVRVDPPLPPVFRGAKRDTRYANDFQPHYPPSLLVREIEGSATIRVLVGTDGRVREAIVVSATHPDFGKAAARQALQSWRFKPATRGNEQVEDWVTIPVTFQIN